METQHFTAYQELRRLGLPAIHALACSRERMALESKCTATGFCWLENRQGVLCAQWQEEGFDLTAVIVNDGDGWWTSGVDCIGRFSSRWAPGAIRHRQGGRNAHEWFVPARERLCHLGDPKEEYRRACAYGRDWWYVGVKVKASRAGVTLGDVLALGIEFDFRPNQQYLTQTALDLATQAISVANEKLKLLCGCH